jgi:hypothetical protein
MGVVTLSAANWTPIGPAPLNTANASHPISGRIVAVAADPGARAGEPPAEDRPMKRPTHGTP